MKNICRHSAQAQTRINKNPSRASESRPNWVICWPNRHKSESWPADFSGVVKLDDLRYWVNAWRNPADFGIQLKAKDSAAPDIWRCLLAADPSGRYIGVLQLEGRTFCVELWEDVLQRILRVHFELEGGQS